MKLTLDDRFRVYSDPRNFILEKLEDVKDRKTGDVKQEWKTVGFFGRFEHLLNTYKNESIRNMEDTSLSEIEKLYLKLDQTIKDVVKRENITLELHKTL